MSENAVNKFALINMEIPESIDTAVKGLTQNPSHAIGDTLSDCWFLVFGGLNEKAEKKRMKIAYALENYRDKLYQAAEEIPAENQQEAKLYIVGPALEKSKYCIEETEIRDMFVQLIAHSMDNRYSNIVHPSFPEIVSQMSPLDAENIKLFANGVHTLPIAEYRTIFGQQSYSVIKSNVFLSNPKVQDLAVQASSLSALSRLGLIVLDYQAHGTDEIEYMQFKQQDFFQNLEKKVVSPPIDGFQSPRDDDLVQDVQVKKGIAKITPLGENFLKVCLP